MFVQRFALPDISLNAPQAVEGMKWEESDVPSTSYGEGVCNEVTLHRACHMQVNMTSLLPPRRTGTPLIELRAQKWSPPSRLCS